MKRSAAVLALAVLLAACQVERAMVGPEGELTILDAAEPQAWHGPPPGWVGEGPDSALGHGLAAVRLGGVPALRIANGPEGFAAVRPTAAILQATPYLTWTWNVEPHGMQGHAVSLVVGFRGGGGRSIPAGNLPDHDRLLVLAWGGSALQRGGFQSIGGDGSARYVARGGRENADRWIDEAVDLSALYAQAWPRDDRNGVTVSFVGVAAAGGQPAGAIHVSRIALTR
jgi:hypothetical protein